MFLNERDRILCVQGISVLWVCAILCLEHVCWRFVSHCLDARWPILALQTGFGVSWKALHLKTKVPVDSQVPKQKSQSWTWDVEVPLLFWDQGTEQLWSVLYMRPKFDKQHSHFSSVCCIWVMTLLWLFVQPRLTVGTVCCWKHFLTCTSPGTEVRSNKGNAVT